LETLKHAFQKFSSRSKFASKQAEMYQDLPILEFGVYIFFRKHGLLFEQEFFNKS